MRAAALLLLLVGAASARDVPPLTGRVVDLADVLSPATEAALTARLQAHEDSTSNQIVVLTIPSLDGEVLETYATEVFRTWGLGQADRDNGVLLLVAVEERELRIEVGYGLEGALTDATSGSIIRYEIVPRFRDGDFDGGVLAGVDAILAAVSGEYQARGLMESAREVPFWQRLLFALIGLAVAGPALASILLWTGGTGLGGDVGAGTLGAVFGAAVSGAAFAVFQTPWALPIGLLGPFLFIRLNRWAEAHPTWGPRRRHFRKKQAAFREARERGDTTVVVDGRSYTVPTASDSGGGFSGGGGSSGGGGASGSW